MVCFKNDWDDYLKNEFEKPYYKKLRGFLKKEYQNGIIYPNAYDIFNALKYTSYNNVKVVILGQDPYHNEKQAHGLAFSVAEGCEIPPSLVNIFKELENDQNIVFPKNGCLIPWALQGVLLLNAVLTVKAGIANSHRKIGWEIFTDKIISLLNERQKPVVFMLWGNNAKEKIGLITNKNHLILQAAHPSPLSATRGFFGCKHFSKANDFLMKNNQKEINWQI